jgi:urea transport system permease protein
MLKSSALLLGLAGVLALAALTRAPAANAQGPVISPEPATAPAAGTAPAAATAAATVSAAGSPADESMAALLAALPDASYADKRNLIRELAALRDPRVRAVLQALLEGSLYERVSDHRLFIGHAASEAGATAEGQAESNDLRLIDPLADPSIAATPSVAAADGFTTIGVNNQLRKALRVALAQFDLASPDVGVRRGAIKEMLRALDADGQAVLRERLMQERDPGVKREIEVGLALADLDSPEAATRLRAVRAVSASLNTDVYNRLSAMVQQSADGSFGEPDPGVRAAAQADLRSIEGYRTLYAAIQTMIYGLSQGSVLVLAAIGLAITFGVMGVINMAHGELMMLGAYTTYVVQLLMPQHIGASVIVAIPAAFLVSGIAGIAIERGIVRHLYGRPLETLLATFGVSLILQQAVRDLFSANNRPVETPNWLAGSLQINDVLAITYNRLYIILFTFALFLCLLAVLKRTRLGLEVRAVSQNRAMAKAMGVRTEWVDALTFGLGSGIAGIAGVALSQLTNVGPNLGQSYIVDSFMVVVFGGVGSLWGTEVGGNALGIVNKVLEPYSGAVLAKIFVLVFLILFIQRRPRGLFPQKGRAAEG